MLFRMTAEKNFQSFKKIKLFFKKGLTKRNKCGIISRYEKNVYVPLAQPDRVFGYEPKGRGFESLKARQTKRVISNGYHPFCFPYLCPKNPR